MSALREARTILTARGLDASSVRNLRLCGRGYIQPHLAAVQSCATCSFAVIMTQKYHQPSTSDDASSGEEEPPLLCPVIEVPPSMSAPRDEQPVGVTLITGFLGSGKSTLVRRILSEPHGLRVLVVENEFGDRVSSSIESAVITPQPGLGDSGLAELIELPNGCVCCAASSDLTDALGRLLREPGKRRFDHVVVEASGLADPGPVAASFWVDEELEMKLRLDAIVAVVDAPLLPSYLSNVDAGKAGLAEKQIAVADVILLNKVDIADSSALANTRAAVESRRNPETLLVESVRCEAPLRKLLNMQAYDRARSAKLVASDMFSGKAVHPHGVGAVSLTFTNVEFDRAKLDRAFGSLLWDDEREGTAGREIWRAKALVSVDERAVLYQAVHTLYEGEEIEYEWPEPANRESKFVFIGRKLEEEYLRCALEKAVYCSTNFAVQ